MPAKAERKRAASRNKPVHLLVISQVFAPDSQATSQLLTDLLLALEGDDLHFTVICGFPADFNRGVPQQRENLCGIDVRRVGIATAYKRSIVGRFAHYVCFLAAASVELCRFREANAVIGLTNPPFAPIWLWLATRLTRHRYFLSLHDIYPDGLVGIGKLDCRGGVVRIWRALNSIAFRRAERIAVLGRDMAELLTREYAVRATKIDYVPNWSVVSTPSPRTAEDTRLCCRLGLRGKFIVQYSGNMGLWHDLETIVRAAAKLQDAPEIHFLMIGEGMRHRESVALAKQLGLKNATWLPFQPKAELGDSLACCHVALISQRNGLNGAAVPCKLYGILASGRAALALAPPGSEAEMVIREEHCGVVISPGDVEGVVVAIRQLNANRVLAMEMGQRALSAAQNKYRLDQAAAKFLAIWRGAPQTRVAQAI